MACERIDTRRLQAQRGADGTHRLARAEADVDAQVAVIVQIISRLVNMEGPAHAVP